jgi:hypothetical protein
MSVVRLVNPVDAIGNAIAEPLEQAAKEFKQLRDLHDNANQHLKQSGHDLEVTMGKDIAQPFADMINKQYQFADGINRGIDQIADLYNEAAQGIRTAAHWVNPILTVSFDLLQWAVDQLTADIVVRQGQSAVQAIFDDLRRQVDRAEHDAGSFFGDLFHLHFNAALHDAEDAGKALLHMAGDALAMIAQVEPLLCQWAEDIFQKVNWCFNQVNSVLLGIVDWVLGLSDMVDEAVVFTDPNSTDLEKWVAGTMLTVNIGLDILMFIPGGQEAIFGRLAEKLGIKFLTRWIAAKIAETIVAQLIKDFIKRLLTKFAESVVKRALERKLTQEIFKSIQGEIEQKLSGVVQGIIEDYLAKKISLAEARARIKALQALGDRFGSEELVALFKRFEADDIAKIARHNINLSDIDKLIADNKKFPLSDTNAVSALTGPDGTASVKIAGAGGEGADITFLDKNGNVILKREVKCIGPGSFSKRLSKAADQGKYAGEVFFQMPAGTDVDSLMGTFRRVRSPEELAKYKNVHLTVVDPSGKPLYNGPVIP